MLSVKIFVIWLNQLPVGDKGFEGFAYTQERELNRDCEENVSMLSVFRRVNCSLQTLRKRQEQKRERGEKRAFVFK